VGVGAGLIFDFDGTILDTEEPVYRSWVELWAEHGEELRLEVWQTKIGTSGSFDPWAELEQRVGDRLDRSLEDRRRARRDELQARHELRPGVLAWLEEAADLGIPVGVASSSSLDWVESHLVRLRIRPYFSALVCAGGGVPVKPDPTSYRMCCELLDADPSHSVAVEDSPHGVAAARGAGLYAVVVPHPLTASMDFSRAQRVVSSLEALTLAAALREAGATEGPSLGGPVSTPGAPE